MDTGTWTLFIGGAIGLALALFGVRMLITGRAPASTARAFRTTRDAGLYHLLFGLGLILLVVGTELPGDVTPIVSAVLAVALAGVAVVRYRPRAERSGREEPVIDPVVDLGVGAVRRATGWCSPTSARTSTGGLGARRTTAAICPGAVFVDLDHDLAAHGAPAGRGPPSAAGSRGRSPRAWPRWASATRTPSIAYDDAGGVMAARLVWMLRATGHQAALLDGGIGAYGGERETERPDRAPAVFSTRPWPADRLADICRRRGRVLCGAGRPAARAVPWRDRADRPAGGPHPGRPQPAVPGECGRGRPFPAGTRAARAVRRGRCRGRDAVVSYCGSGVTACHNLLALEHAGLGVGRLYPGSWSQYSTYRPTGGDRGRATGD